MTALLAMLAYVPFCFVAFRRWPAPRAALITLLVGAMFLPANYYDIDLPLTPPLTKELWCPLWALIACWTFRRSALTQKIWTGPCGFLCLLFLSGIVTILTNTDSVTLGVVSLPGSSSYDLVYSSIVTFLTWIPAYYLGFTLFRTKQDLHLILKYFSLAGLVYSLLCLWEIRMSPQLHLNVYGYAPSSFFETIRFGGYRPVVFMRHGLCVALFMTLTLVAAATLYRARWHLSDRIKPGHLTAWLVVVLILIKSAGAWFYGAIALAALLTLKGRHIAGAAVAIATLVVVYPLLRVTDIVSADQVRELMAHYVNPERARSLWGRMMTEAQIMESTRDRIMFGWGGYGRFMRYDPLTGQSMTIPDGHWAIALGSSGVVGWACLLAAMMWPAVNALRSMRLITDESTRISVGGLALLTAIYLLDWLPNAPLAMELSMITGALAGYVHQLRRRRRAALPRVQGDRRVAVDASTAG